MNTEKIMHLDFTNLSVSSYINIVLFVLLILSYLIYKTVAKRNKENPEYQRRLKERREEEIREAKRLRKEYDDLEAYMSKEDYDMPNDDDYEED